VMCAIALICPESSDGAIAARIRAMRLEERIANRAR
jgi:hypothetical protein